jgi:hypothetical protein
MSDGGYERSCCGSTTFEIGCASLSTAGARQAGSTTKLQWPKRHLGCCYIDMGFANGKLGIDEAGIDHVIAEAEHIAFAKDWRPPLAAN